MFAVHILSHLTGNQPVTSVTLQTGATTMTTFTDLVTFITNLGGIVGPLFTFEDSGNLTLSMTLNEWSAKTWDEGGPLSRAAYEEALEPELETLNLMWRDALCTLWNTAVGDLGS